MSRVWYPYTQMLGLAPPQEFVRGRGAWLETAGGDRYLDAISSWWVTLHGHGEPRIAEAIARQARELEHCILAGYTHPLAEELAERLVEITPRGLNHVFYTDDGSTAVEAALKMALQCWQQRGQPQRRHILALEHAYHGDTLGAMSVSAASPFTAAFAGWLFPVERVPPGDLAALATLLDARGAEMAAMIVEPLLQGSGGMLVYSAEYLRGVRALCARHGVLLIADEVLTGFGRTSRGDGTLFACEQAGIVPDLLCLSKGLTAGFLPLAATLCSDAVYEAFLSQDRRQTLFHGHSFTGNPLGCAAALASLEIFATDSVMERIRGIAATHAHHLQRLQQHPRVREVRQAGTVGALEVRGGGDYLAEIGPRLRRFYHERKIILRPLGPVVYVLPPYCTQTEELDEVWNAVEASLDRVDGTDRAN